MGAGRGVVGVSGLLHALLLVMCGVSMEIEHGDGKTVQKCEFTTRPEVSLLGCNRENVCPPQSHSTMD